MASELQTVLNKILSDKNKNILPANLRMGVTTLGVKGNYSNDATAAPDDIVSPKTAYTRGQKVTGTMVFDTEPLGSNCYRLATTLSNTGTIGASNDDGIILILSSSTLYVYQYDFETNMIDSLGTVNASALSGKRIKMTNCMYDGEDWCVLITYAKSGTYNSGDSAHIAELTYVNGKLTFTGALASMGSNRYFMSPQFAVNNNNDIFVVVPDRTDGSSVYGDIYEYLTIYKITYTPFSGKVSYSTSLSRTKIHDGDYQHDSGGAFLYYSYHTLEDNQVVLVLGFDYDGNAGAYKVIRMNSTLSSIVNNTQASSSSDYTTVAYKDLYIRTYERSSGNFEFTIYKWNGSGYTSLKTIKKDMTDVITNSSRKPMTKLVDNMLVISALMTNGTSIQFIAYIENEDLRFGEVFDSPIGYTYTHANADDIQTNKRFAIMKRSNNTYLFELQNEGVRRLSLNDGTYSYYNTYNADVTDGDVLSEKIYYGINGKSVGTMPDNGTLNYTPAQRAQRIPSGYTSGGTIQGDSNLISSNIRADKTIFGITGSAPITFSTIEEMNSHTDFPEDTYCIVYGTTYYGTYRLDNGAWTQIGDSTEDQQIMDVLNEIADTTDQFEGVGGTDEKISEVLDEILGNGGIE